MYKHIYEIGFNKNQKIRKICEVFEKNIRPITPIEYGKILIWMKHSNCDLIILSIEEVGKRNIKNIRYIDAYLKLIKEYEKAKEGC